MPFNVKELAKMRAIFGGGAGEGEGGSGGGFVVHYGTFTPSARTGPYTVTHNWGIRPDCIIFTGYTNGNTDNNDIVAGFGVSQKFYDLFPSISNGLSISRVKGAVLMSTKTYDNGYGHLGHIANVTENSFDVGSSSIKVFTSEYQYILIAIQ